MVAMSSAGRTGLEATIWVARSEASTLSLLRGLASRPWNCAFRIWERLCELRGLDAAGVERPLMVDVLSPEVVGRDVVGH